MPQEFIRRAAMPVVGLAAVALFGAACSSSTSGSGSNGDSSAPADTSAPADSSAPSSGGGLNAGNSSEADSGTTSAANGGGGAAASSVNNGGGGSTAKFCAVFKTAGSQLGNVSKNPDAVIGLYEKLDAAAPSDIKPAVDSVLSALRKAKSGDTSGVGTVSENATKVSKYAVNHCI